MTKKGHVERFLKHGDKVKVTIMFRGREQAHPERGRNLLARLFEDLDGLAVIEQNPLQEGRNMHMLLAPSKEALREQKTKTGEQPAVSEPEAEGQAPEPAAEAEAAEPEVAAAEVPDMGSGSDAAEAEKPAADEVPDASLADTPEPAEQSEAATG
jgi:translation initiation factor IF-3